MKDAITTGAYDTPWVGAAAFALWGVSLEKWVVILAALYGVVRLTIAAFELFWKLKDRYGSKRDSTKDPAP